MNTVLRVAAEQDGHFIVLWKHIAIYAIHIFMRKHTNKSLIKMHYKYILCIFNSASGQEGYLM